jgi:hypothetical protein
MEDELEGHAARPPYVEAWPRLHVQQVAAAALKDRTLTVYTDDRGLRVGYALVDDEGDDTFSFDYRLEKTRHLQAGRAKQLFALHLVPGVNKDKATIAMTDCPLCSRRVRICVFVSEWGCSRCHGLTNRSNFTDHIAAMHIERDDLSASVALGRVRYQRQAAFDAMAARLAVLNRKLGNRPRRSPVGTLTYAVHASYVEPATDEFYRQDH